MGRMIAEPSQMMGPRTGIEWAIAVDQGLPEGVRVHAVEFADYHNRIGVVVEHEGKRLWASTEVNNPDAIMVLIDGIVAQLEQVNG